MSADGLRVVQEIYGAFARRDTAAVFARLHSDVEIRQTELLLLVGPNRDQEGARTFYGRRSQAIDSAVKVERLIDSWDHEAGLGLR